VELRAHHFASFNNQWYRKSIEYMQDTVGNGAPPNGAPGATTMQRLFAGSLTLLSSIRSTLQRRRQDWVRCLPFDRARQEQYGSGRF
jgi:hypothetical protein